jgi:hypothetical protein
MVGGAPERPRDEATTFSADSVAGLEGYTNLAVF